MEDIHGRPVTSGGLLLYSGGAPHMCGTPQLSETHRRGQDSKLSGQARRRAQNMHALRGSHAFGLVWFKSPRARLLHAPEKQCESTLADWHRHDGPHSSFLPLNGTFHTSLCLQAEVGERPPCICTSVMPSQST